MLDEQIGSPEVGVGAGEDERQNTEGKQRKGCSHYHDNWFINFIFWLLSGGEESYDSI